MVRWAVDGYLFVLSRGDGLELWSVQHPNSILHNGHQTLPSGNHSDQPSDSKPPWSCSYVRTLRYRSTGVSVVCAFETDTNSFWAVTKQSALYVYRFE